MDLSQLVDLYSNPSSVLKEQYKKGSPSFTESTLIDLCQKVKNTTGINDDLSVKIEKSLLGVMYATLQIRRWCRYRKSEESSSNPVYLYQYTSASTFDNVFGEYVDENTDHPETEPKFWLAPTDYLNDPEEGKYFYNKLRNQIQLDSEKISSSRGFLNDFFHYVDSDRSFIGLNADTPVVFSASFCNAEDNLNLWRFYGDKGKGVSFGISENNFDHSSEEAKVHLSIKKSKKANTHDPLYRIRYGDELTNYAISLLLPPLNFLSENLKNVGDKAAQDLIRTVLFTLLQTVAFLFKSESYADECEFRIMRISTLGEDNPQLKYVGNKVFLVSNTPFISPRPEGTIEDRPDEPTKITVGPNHVINRHKRSNLESSRVDISYKVNKAINSFKDTNRPSPIIKISNKKFRATD